MSTALCHFIKGTWTSENFGIHAAPGINALRIPKDNWESKVKVRYSTSWGGVLNPLVVKVSTVHWTVKLYNFSD